MPSFGSASYFSLIETSWAFRARCETFWIIAYVCQYCSTFSTINCWFASRPQFWRSRSNLISCQKLISFKCDSKHRQSLKTEKSCCLCFVFFFHNYGLSSSYSPKLIPIMEILPSLEYEVANYSYDLSLICYCQQAITVPLVFQKVLMT